MVSFASESHITSSNCQIKISLSPFLWDNVGVNELMGASISTVHLVKFNMRKHED